MVAKGITTSYPRDDSERLRVFSMDNVEKAGVMQVGWQIYMPFLTFYQQSVY